MATITLTMTTDMKTRLINAYYYGYQTEIIDETGTIVPNPQTKTQFALENFKEAQKQKIQSVETQIAMNAIGQPAEVELTIS